MAFGVNTVATSKGKAITAARLLGATPAQVEPKFLAIGVGATGAARTAAAGDIALSSEQEARSGTNAGTQTTTGVAGDTYTVTNTIIATAARVVDEAMLFDAVTGNTGNSFVSSTFNVINLVSGDSIQITYNCQFS